MPGAGEEESYSENMALGLPGEATEGPEVPGDLAGRRLLALGKPS